MEHLNDPRSTWIPRVFVICDQTDTAPIWGYILRQEGLHVILETSPDKALDRWSTETPDLAVIDIDATHQEPMILYKKFRTLGDAPILLFLPAHHETQILDAYAAGVDDVIVKPISPAIFLAKIKAWARRSKPVSVEGTAGVSGVRHRLDSTRRCFIDPDGNEVKLTNLEFRLLHLLMSRPSYLFTAEDIVQAIWGGHENGDQVMLKNVVYRLRRKIESDPANPALLQTWAGGYSFQG